MVVIVDETLSPLASGTPGFSDSSLSSLKIPS